MSPYIERSAPTHHAMKAYRVVEVKLHTSWTKALDVQISTQLHAPVDLLLGNTG
jgi:hypothetical protein